MSNSEWEEQQEANRIIEKYGGLGTPQDERQKYTSLQPATTQVRELKTAEDLIIAGEIFLRVEPGPDSGMHYVFAGKKPAEIAKAIAQGKLSLEDSPRGEAARKYAQQKIQAAIVECERNSR